MRMIKAALLVLVLGALGATSFVYFGGFNTAADVPHWPIVYELMETARQRSIAVRAGDIAVPPLDDAKMIAAGAEHYGAMCGGCHLAPGVTESEIRQGLYPQPPNLTQRTEASPAQMFWTIKHGIKMSAMPAWGGSHDDAAIWDIVAFLRKLPELTPQQYQAMVRDSGDNAHGHHHDAGGSADGEPADTDAGEHHHGQEPAGGREGQDDAHGEAAAHDHAHPPAAANGPDRSDATTHAAKPDEGPISLDGLTAHAVPEAEALALAFHRALAQADRAGVLALLSADATVSESGHTQSRSEYASGHLGEDIAFLRNATVRPISLASLLTGETARVGSESEIRATIKGRQEVLRSVELLTLRRENGIWKIITVRWQSSGVNKNFPQRREAGRTTVSMRLMSPRAPQPERIGLNSSLTWRNGLQPGNRRDAAQSNGRNEP